MITQARILIIEDERDVREMMQFDLTHAGYAVETAPDGIKGLESFHAGEPWDLVLLDQNMPRLNGLEVLRRMCGCEPGARVIMVTAYATLELTVEAMKSGALDFLRKPFAFDVLRGAVKAALAQPRRQTTDCENSALVHSLNGFRFRPVLWPVSQTETDRLRVRRAFEVQAPSGETRWCTVDVTLYAREVLRMVMGHDYAPPDAVWNWVCASALSDYLWREAAVPPQTLPVYDLTAQQLQAIRERLDSGGMDGLQTANTVRQLPLCA